MSFVQKSIVLKVTYVKLQFKLSFGEINYVEVIVQVHINISRFIFLESTM